MDEGVTFRSLTCDPQEQGLYKVILEVDVRADSSIEAAGWMLALLDQEA